MERRVAGERRLRILARLVDGNGADLGTTRLCQVCADITGTTGAGLMLMSGDVPHGSVCTTDEVSALIEDLQYSLGEGPCVDAFQLDRPVAEPNLVAPRVPRWFAFSPPAVAAGVRAIFGFPMQVGAVRLGALNLYCDHPGPLSDDQHADALVMASVAAQAVLFLQSDAPAGALAEALEANADFQYVVHQASGMMSVQLGVTVAEALIRVRAYAFADGRPLHDVARDVVARTLRFDTDDGPLDHHLP